MTDRTPPASRERQSAATISVSELRSKLAAADASFEGGITYPTDEYADAAYAAYAAMPALLDRLDVYEAALRALANFEGIVTPCGDRHCVECQSARIAREALNG